LLTTHHVFKTSELLELMQQVQEYGQPPQEIIQDIAPGLELDEDGMPKMNPMMPGLGGGDEDCRMM
jgi:peroxin-19